MEQQQCSRGYTHTTAGLLYISFWTGATAGGRLQKVIQSRTVGRLTSECNWQSILPTAGFLLKFNILLYSYTIFGGYNIAVARASSAMAHVLAVALAAAQRFEQDDDHDGDDSGSKDKDVVFENMRYVRKCSFVANSGGGGQDRAKMHAACMMSGF